MYTERKISSRRVKNSLQKVCHVLRLIVCSWKLICLRDFTNNFFCLFDFSDLDFEVKPTPALEQNGQGEFLFYYFFFEKIIFCTKSKAEVQFERGFWGGLKPFFSFWALKFIYWAWEALNCICISRNRYLDSVLALRSLKKLRV